MVKCCVLAGLVRYITHNIHLGAQWPLLNYQDSKNVPKGSFNSMFAPQSLSHDKVRDFLETEGYCNIYR